MHCLVPRPLPAAGTQCYVAAISLQAKNPDLRRVQCIQAAEPARLAPPWNCWRIPVASKAPRSQCLPALGPRCPWRLMLHGGCAVESPGKRIPMCKLRNAKGSGYKIPRRVRKDDWADPDWDGRLAKPWCVAWGTLQRGCPTPDCRLGLLQREQ